MSVCTRKRRGVIALVTVVMVWTSGGRAADWPMWRHDARRSACTKQSLPERLHLQWTREFPAPRPAWPASQTKLRFDDSYEPIVAGELVIVGSSTDDSVSAFDVSTGERRWRFETDGPVRFAAVSDGSRVHFVSDDGFLYCVNHADGALLWKHRGGPNGRTLLGNDRVVSAWPVRGAPVVHEGSVYFAAGIWPFTGIFLHALDAQSGAVRWSNTSSGSTFLQQQHNSPAFAGVAPQGYLAVAGDALLVSGGRTVPAAYDLADGAFRYFRVSSRQFGKAAGGYQVAAEGDWFLNGGAVYETPTGKGLLQAPVTVLHEGTFYGIDEGALVAWEWAKESEAETSGEKVKPRLAERWRLTPQRPLQRLFLKAGSLFYASCGEDTVVAIAAPSPDSPARIVGEYRVEGEPLGAIAAADRLFISTRPGALHCFGSESIEGDPPLRTPAMQPEPLPVASSPRSLSAMEATGVKEGWCVVLGLDDEDLVLDLARRGTFSVVAIGADAERVLVLRRKLRAAGLYGREAHILPGNPATFPLPPYLADLVVCQKPGAEGMGRQIARILRPCGGVACVTSGAPGTASLLREAVALGLPVAAQEDGPWCVLRREGSPPG
jgi:putative pyrroloquinoline-quinone binding quinoprotein